MAEPLAGDLSLLPLKAGDHLCRPASGGRAVHGLYVGQYTLDRAPPVGEAASELLLVPGGAQGEAAAAAAPPHSVLVVRSEGGSSGVVALTTLADFVGLGAAAPGCTMKAEEERLGMPTETTVRLYTRRPRGRRAAVARGLKAVGVRVDGTAVAAFPELLPWWAIFDESETFQPGLCATRARAVRYRLTPRGDAPVQASVTNAVLAGGTVVQKGRVVLRGLRLMRALRLSKAAVSGWASLGGMVGQTIAANLLDDGRACTSAATTAGGWAGGLAGGGLAAAAASSVGMETLGAGSLAGGLVVCGSMSAVGAVAGAGLAYAAKKVMETPSSGQDRTAEYHDGVLRLVGEPGDVFHLFDAALEFPAEDDEEEQADGSAGAASTDGSDSEAPRPTRPAKPAHSERLPVAGWYAVRV